MTSIQQRSEWEMLLKKAQTAFRAGQFSEAEEQYQQSLAAAEKEFGRDSSHCALVLCDLAECYEAQGKETAAEECFEQIRDVLKAVHR